MNNGQGGVDFEIPPSRKRASGRWKPGESGNPRGSQKHGQSFKDRMTYWLENSTYRDLCALAADDKRMGKLITLDVLVINRIMDACQRGNTQDFVVLLDRLLGKPAVSGELHVTHELGARLDAAEKILAQEVEFEEVHARALPIPD